MVAVGMNQVLPLSVDWLGLSIRMLSTIMGCPAGHTWAKYGETYDRVPYVSVEVNFHGKAVQTFPQEEREKVYCSDQELIHHDDLA